MKSWPTDAERELWAEYCTPGRNKNSLFWFIMIAWGLDRSMNDPGQLKWFTRRVHRPFMRWFQRHVMKWKAMRLAGKVERYRLGIIVPRGFGKTTAITRAANLWLHLDDPNMTSYIGSETHPKAKGFLRPIKAVMMGQDLHAWFSWLYGNWYSPEREWTSEYIFHAFRTQMSTSEPSIGTFGVETGITGAHPLAIFYDDPLSKEKLKEGGSWLTAVLDSFDAIYPALRTDSLFAFILTRYLDNDVAGTAINVDGVASWEGHPPDDARVKTSGGVWHIYFLQGRDVSKREVYPEGEPVLPEVWPDADLLHYEKTKPADYAAQIMNSPGSGEHMELDREQIANMVIPRKALPPIEYATIHIDTAFKDDTRRDQGDYNAIVVWLHDLRPTGIVYLDRVLRDNSWRGEQFDDELVKILVDLRRRGIRVRGLTDETEMGGKRGVYRQHLEQVIGGAGLRIPEIFQLNRAGTKKIMRIREAAGYWVDGFVRIIEDAQGREHLESEMLRIGVTAHDDVSDAAADVFRPEVWRRPTRLEGDDEPRVVIPGDEVLKQIAPPLTMDYVRELYDETFGGPDDDGRDYESGDQYEQFRMPSRH